MGTGFVSRDVFAEGIAKGRLRAYLSVLGLDIKDAEMFFGMLAIAGGRDEVSIEAFVEGCMRMKGLATSLDLQTLTYRTQLIQQAQKRSYEGLVRRLEGIEGSLKKTEAQSAQLMKSGGTSIFMPLTTSRPPSSSLNPPTHTVQGNLQEARSNEIGNVTV